MTAAAAHAHYMQGEFFNSRRAPGDEKRTIDHFRQALAIDPTLADAWVGLAGALLVQMSVQVPANRLVFREVVLEIGAALKTALELNPAHAEAHVLMGQYEHGVRGNDTLAHIHYRKAWQYGRNDTQMLARFSGIALHNQNLEEALYLQRQAVALDPLSYISRGNLGVLLYWSGHFDEARAEYLHAKILNPARATQINKDLALVLIQQHKYAEAEQLLLDANSSSQRDRVLAMAYHARGKPLKSQAAANRLSTTPGVEPAVYLAEVYAFIGDFDRSLDWLAVASQRYFAQEYFLQDWRTMHDAFFSPFLKPLMGDPRLLAWRSDTLEELRTARANSAELYADAGL